MEILFVHQFLLKSHFELRQKLVVLLWLKVSFNNSSIKMIVASNSLNVHGAIKLAINEILNWTETHLNSRLRHDLSTTVVWYSDPHCAVLSFFYLHLFFCFGLLKTLICDSNAQILWKNLVILNCPIFWSLKVLICWAQCFLGLI